MKEILTQVTGINQYPTEAIVDNDGLEVIRNVAKESLGMVAVSTVSTSRDVAAMDDQVPRSWDLHKY